MTIESTSDKLRAEVRGRTVLVTIDNPPANTWDRDNLAALTDLVDQCERDADVYAIVVTGAGTRFFSAGADLKVFAEGGKAVAEEMAAAFGRAFERLADYRGVTIAAINGYAMGGGLECAMACDIRIVESQAAMALPEASVGLLPCGGGTQNLAWLVGEGWAKRMILCGERVAADTAVEDRPGRGGGRPGRRARCRAGARRARVGPGPAGGCVLQAPHPAGAFVLDRRFLPTRAGRVR